MFFYKIRNNIPNLITTLNLTSGVIAILFSFENQLIISSIFIYVGFFLDYMDGFFARILNAKSNIGKELDSLADLVTFGLAPACIVYNLLKKILYVEGFINISLSTISLIFPLLIVIFSAIRLAKFNIDTKQEENFIGLPTPANAIYFAWLPFLLCKNNLYQSFIDLYIYLLIIPSLLNSFLLVSPIPFFSFKFKNFNFYENKKRYIFLAYSLLIIILLTNFAIIIIFWSYVLLNISLFFLNLFKKSSL